ncbi:MAG: hypothetical protein MJ252_00575 [archaeon]|nr:hypothetical protein [archaeon]
MSNSEIFILIRITLILIFLILPEILFLFFFWINYECSSVFHLSYSSTNIMIISLLLFYFVLISGYFHKEFQSYFDLFFYLGIPIHILTTIYFSFKYYLTEEWFDCGSFKGISHFWIMNRYYTIIALSIFLLLNTMEYFKRPMINKQKIY